MVVLVKFHPFTESSANASAQLQCCSLASCRTSAGMSQNCCNHNKRSHPKRYIRIRLDAFQYFVRSGLIRIQFINGYDQKSRCRQQIQHPRMPVSECRHFRNTFSKQSSKDSQNNSCRSCHQHPPNQQTAPSKTFLYQFFHIQYFILSVCCHIKRESAAD